MEEAIQEHAEEIQQMKEDFAKMNACDAAARTSIRRKAVENDGGEKCRERWSPSNIALNGWVDWHIKIETVMDICGFEKTPGWHLGESAKTQKGSY